jgi:hypothetical protein
LEKYRADLADRHLNTNSAAANQILPEFLIEACLMHSDSNEKAEMYLYQFMNALEEYIDYHPLIKTFARFLGITSKSSEVNASTDIGKVSGNPKMTRRRSSVSSIDEVAILRESAISMDLLSIYLVAREAMLSEYTGIYQTYISNIKSMDEHSIADISKQAKKSEQHFIIDAESQFFHDSNMSIELPRHICISSSKAQSISIGASYRFWIPLDRLIRVLRACLSFLDKMVGYRLS